MLERLSLQTDERGVSPVIGVILMVAITVILAAVIGTFVMGLGDTSAAPTVSFDWSTNSTNTNVAAIHNGGDTLTASTLSVSGDCTTLPSLKSGEFTAGDTVLSGGDCSSGSTVRIVWQNPEGGDTQVIGEYTVP